MSSPHDPYNSTGDYSNTRRHSFQPSPGSQHRFAELPALSGSTNVNRELAHGYDLAYLPHSPIDASMNYYSTGTSSPGHYGTANQYQRVHSPTYQHHAQDTVPIPYASGQSTRDVYPESGVNEQWTAGHHNLGADFHRSASWPQHHVSHSAPRMSSHGSTSMAQIHAPSNNRERREVAVPQRPYTPHHRQNYFDQFIPENPITFPSRSGREGIALADVTSENFDHLVGRDDPMFANYTGPAISLRLEWPGYKSWTKQIKTKDWRRDPKPITKAKLATEVAKKVQSFIQDNVDEAVSFGAERWRIGPGFIEVKDLVLVRLVHVSKGSWQAEFRAIE